MSDSDSDSDCVPAIIINLKPTPAPRPRSKRWCRKRTPVVQRRIDTTSLSLVNATGYECSSSSTTSTSESDDGQNDNHHFITPVKRRRNVAKDHGCNARQVRYYQKKSRKVDKGEACEEAQTISAPGSEFVVPNIGLLEVEENSYLSAGTDELELDQTVLSEKSFSSSTSTSSDTSDISSILTSETEFDYDSSSTCSRRNSINSSSPYNSSTTESDASEISESDVTFEYDADRDKEHQKKLCDAEPLFDGCNHSKISLYTALALINIKHACTGELLSDVLRLISSLLPDTSRFSPSLYKFKETLKQFSGYEEPDVHQFCGGCQALLSSRNDICECLSNDKKVLEFVGLNVDKQIKELFIDKTFCELVFRSRSNKPGVLRDITDGEGYRLGTNQGVSGDNVVHLSFTMNTDGVAVFKSSKKGNLWPVYLAINELPVQLRFSKKYIIPCSMYCQVEKPNMMTYLLPLMKKFQLFQDEGLKVVTPFGAKVFKGHLLMAPLDLPARAMVTNMKQFNGRYACVFCHDQGETNQKQIRYPFNEACEMRTHQSILNDAGKAMQNREPERGIKGASALALLKDVNLSEAFPVDWMHCVLSGVVKALLKYWLHTKYRLNKLFYIGDKVALLDKKLLMIQAPDFVARKQRSLSECQHWKATECREWLIHYGVPVLERSLTGDPFIHFCLLATAVAILSKEEVSLAEVRYAEDMILDFCRMFPDIYGIHTQTMNVHLLRHLPKCVRLYGPVFNFSCFGFESMNSSVKKMIHGSRHVNSQISFAVGITKSLPSMLQGLVKAREKTKIDTLFHHLSGRILREYSFGVNEEGDVIGKGAKLEAVHKDNVCTFLGCEPSDVTTYRRFRHRDGQLVACNKKTKNAAIAFLTRDGTKHGLIKTFPVYKSLTYALVQKLEEKERAFTFPDTTNPRLIKYREIELLPHLRRVKKGGMTLIPVGAIQRKCVYMAFGSKIFVSEPPNLVEHD